MYSQICQLPPGYYSDPTRPYKAAEINNNTAQRYWVLIGFPLIGMWQEKYLEPGQIWSPVIEVYPYPTAMWVKVAQSPQGSPFYLDAVNIGSAVKISDFLRSTLPVEV